MSRKHTESRTVDLVNAEGTPSEATTESSTAKKTSSAPKKKAGKISQLRTVVLLVIFLSILVGLFLGNGWGTFSSMGIGAIATICPVGALETLVTGQIPALRTLLALVCVVAVVALIGRAFCAWVCPVPPLRRFFRPNADKLKKKTKETASDNNSAATVAVETATDAASVACAIEPLTAEETAHLSSACSSKTTHNCTTCASCALPPVGGQRDGFKFDSRHGVLIGALASSALFGFPVFCLICPAGLTIAVVVGIYRTLFQQDPTVSVLIFAGILLIEVVFFRKWCHKICPIGALMSLVGAKAPLLKPRVASDLCLREQGIDCQACVKVCPEKLDPHSPSLPECTKCGLCIEACPAQAITFRKKVGARLPQATEGNLSGEATDKPRGLVADESGAALAEDFGLEQDITT